MKIKFGQTWWGEQWLQALAQVDYENRLPRGAAYARNGHVESLLIKENTITAKVSGSRRSPYKVSIVVPPFFNADIGKLIEAIKKRPALIAGLLNRELAPEILEIACKAGLRIFPRQWSDFKMQCTCPDWAVPCKHLAAVVYMVSREIDNDPFLVFTMHRVDLGEELHKQGICIAQQENTEIPTLARFLKTRRGKRKAADAESVSKHTDWPELQTNGALLAQLLSDAPPFYPAGNFKTKYSAQMARISKTAGRVVNGKLSLAHALGMEENQPAISHYTNLSLGLDADNELKLAGEHLQADSLEILLVQLSRLNPDYLPDYQPSVAVLWKTLFASLLLLQSGNYIPQIARLANRTFVLRWLPARMEPTAAELVDALEGLLTFDLLYLHKTSRGKNLLRPLESQAEPLLSVFMTCLVAHFSKPAAKQDSVENFFFGNMPSHFSGVGEKALSGGIKAWIDRYQVAASRYRPILLISEVPATEDFEVALSIEDGTNFGSAPIPLATILTEPVFAQERFHILSALSQLSPFIHGLDAYINQGGTTPIRFNREEFAPFLLEILPAIRLLGMQVFLPKSLQQLLRPQVSLKMKRNREASGYLRLENLLAFDWQIAIGDALLSPQEFEALLNKATGLFRFKERYVYVSGAELARLHKQFTAPPSLQGTQLLRLALAGEYEGAPIALTPEVLALLEQFRNIEDISLPDALRTSLRPYQERGYAWMYRNSRIGFGSVIADDMGLGKTVQVIALLLKLKEENRLDQDNRALITVPTGLLTNWQAELERFAPSLSVHLFHGPQRSLKDSSSEILLTSYGVLRSDAAKLKKQPWQVMIIDEAQHIKNQETALARAVKSMPAAIRIAMSGTPVENRLGEFWSIMEYANPGYLGTMPAFRKDYADPIQLYNDAAAVKKFRLVTTPFMMRRMKSDKAIIADLPDKVEQNQWALLTSAQAALYETTMRAAMDEIEGLGDEHSLFRRQGLVLQMVLALKQICNHPASFLKKGNNDPTLSGKTTLLFDLLDSILDAGEKVLIFTQFREMGNLLEGFIGERYGVTPLFYHGGCSMAQRTAMVRRFQENRADKIFILSLKAAGVGLNLTAASQVIHYDLWWNPAVENQATDRAYRIGQKKNVMVHRLITQNTFEERIDAMIQQKKALADMTVATGETWIGSLSNKELREIFA